MKITFFVFRHGETDWNKLRKVQGQTDIELNETGIEQAVVLKEFFASRHIEICYSSDLKRAYKTAEISLQGLDCEIIKESSLREASFGEVEGMLRDTILKKYKERFWDTNSNSSHSQNFSYPGGETRKQVRDRVVDFINKVVKEEKYQSIGISTHGGTLRSLLHSFLPDDAELLPIPNCVVYKLEFEYGKFKVSGPLNNN
jgi:broad specificity phosphatase PhoE